MILGNIENFEWLNEPPLVSFTESGLQISAQSLTDFWQNTDCGFSKDNGHFFFTSTEDDFVVDCKWFFDEIRDSAQCGAMVRLDENNWIKVGLLSPNIYNAQIGVVVAQKGSSDWSMIQIPADCHSLWFKIKRCGKDFVVYYSLDGEKYFMLRVIHMPEAIKKMTAGAYACSPKKEMFECVLEELVLKKL